MTCDDIIRWAKQSGWKRVGHNPDSGPEFPVLIENLERFAALVAAEKDAEIARLRASQCECQRIGETLRSDVD